MKEIVTIALIGTLLIGMLTQLETIAQDSAQKAIEFSDDMNSAMDCATKGIPLKECSPNLMSHDFSKEVDEFKETLDQANLKQEETEEKTPQEN